MMKNLYYSSNKLFNTIFFRPINFLLLLSLLQTGEGLHASYFAKKGFEWRPKEAVEIPRKSYMLLGGGGITASQATLWTTPHAYMMRLKKNSWKKIHPDNCDADSKKILNDSKVQSFFQSGGQIMVNRLPGGDLILRLYIPGR